MTERADQREGAAEVWDAEYAAGRYRDEPPLPFVAEVLAAASEHCLPGAEGLYVGCGNGRNYLPLVKAGLALIGLDFSRAALAQLAKRGVARRERLVHGDLAALPAGATYPLVIGIQVFQHGDRGITHAHIRAAQARLAPGGLFCLRMNAIGTELEHANNVVERDAAGGDPIHNGPTGPRGVQWYFAPAS